ncbi:MAG: tRNA (cytidine(34)-2'-O)-methyltransferase [Alphaproteobacteria bacterium]
MSFAGKLPLTSNAMRLALYQPDIPQNTGTILRLAACLGVPVDLIEPLGFAVSDRDLKRAGMDNLEAVDISRHRDFETFRGVMAERGGRLLLATTRGDTPFLDFRFAAGDVLLLGRESAGVPEEVHRAAAARLLIPMRGGLRSLNVALAAAMVLSEALRQTGGFPKVTPGLPCSGLSRASRSNRLQARDSGSSAQGRGRQKE